MKVYVLTADTYCGGYGSSIELFGVFSTEEKAIEQASCLKLEWYDVSCVNIDDPEEHCFLGGYIE
jgi:hypothetical protein